MHTHNSDQEPEEIDLSKGYEATDVRIAGVVVFVVAMGIFVVVAGLVAYGTGKILNAHYRKADGPPNRWAQTVDVRPLGNLPSSPELENRLAGLTAQMPAPKLQTDDGLQDTAELHAREDLLLSHYSWVDASQTKVRIPIERAMELVAQRGLPVAAPVASSPLLFGDQKPEVAVPLTNGFTRTGYEQEVASKVH